MEQKIFNGKIFQREIGIYKIDNKLDTYIELFEDNLSKSILKNNLFDNKITLTLYYNDNIDSKLLQYDSDGNTYIDFLIHDISEENDILYKINHTFIVDDIKIVESKNDKIEFIITAISNYFPILMSSLMYSSKAVKSTTKIIEEQLYNANLPFNKNKFTHSPRFYFYINDINNSLFNEINDLLDLSVNEITGFYFLRFNLIKNKFEIISLVDQFDKNSIGNSNVLKIPSNYGYDRTEFITHDLEIDNYFKGTNLINKSSDITYKQFDYINRKWINKNYNFNVIKRFFKYNKNDIDKMDLFIKDSKQYIKNGKNFKLEYLKYCDIGRRFKDILKYTMVLNFTCIGELTREVGDLFFIQIDNINQEQYEKFVGSWIISDIFHIWENDQYRQEISLIRTYKKKENFDKNV